jgi:hypothetical protein
MPYSPNLRYHTPALADMTMEAISETTFQIPSSLSSTSQLLLDDCDDFFAGMDPALSTPAPPASLKPWEVAPLTLADLTPRSKRMKGAQQYNSSTVSRKPIIPSPPKSTVAHRLGTPIKDRLSPVKSHPDLSFEAPQLSSNISHLLVSEGDRYVYGKDTECSFPCGSSITPLAPHNPLTFSQLASGESITIIFRDAMAKYYVCLVTDAAPNTSDSSFSEGPSTPKLSPLSLVNATSTLQSQMTGSDGHNSATTQICCQGSSNACVSDEAAVEYSMDDPHGLSLDEIMRPTLGLEDPAGTPETYELVGKATITVPPPADYRKSASKQVRTDMSLLVLLASLVLIAVRY